MTFVLAPLPNALFPHCGSNDFSAESSGLVDLGRFITSIIVVTGFAFPIVLAHAEVIRMGACVTSIVGGGWAFSLLPSFIRFFDTLLQVGLRYHLGLQCRIQAGRFGIRLMYTGLARV